MASLAILSALMSTMALAELPNYLTGNSSNIAPTKNYPAAATGSAEDTRLIQDLLRSNGKGNKGSKKGNSDPTPTVGSYLLPPGSAQPTYSMTLYPIAATAPKFSKDQCFAKINLKLKEITENEIKKTKQNGAIGLQDLLNNQTEKSFIKFSRAFIRAGYYRYTRGEDKASVLTQLEKELDLVLRSEDKGKSNNDAKIIEDFFNAISKGNKTPDSFDQFSKALRRYSKSDDPDFHINNADLLVMKSIINYTRSPNQRKMLLSDRLLDQMRQVFPKRDFEKDDLETMKNYHRRYQDEANSESYSAAKKAFAEQAKAVITSYAKSLGSQCHSHYFTEDGKLKKENLPENCNSSNYLESLFSADPLSNMDPLLEYLVNEDLAWDSDQFVRVAGVKATPKYCQITEGNKLTISLDIENLPMKFTKHWYLSCAECDQGDAPLTNEKLAKKFEETRTLQFKGKAPTELYIANPEIPHQVKVSLDKCQYLPTLEEEVLSELDTPTATPTTPEAPVAANDETAKDETVVADEQKTEECEDPTQEKIDGKCVPQCKENEIRDEESKKCIDNSPDALLGKDKDKKGKAEELRTRRSGSGRSSASLPQPQLIPIPQNSFYIKAGFN